MIYFILHPETEQMNIHKSSVNADVYTNQILRKIV